MIRRTLTHLAGLAAERCEDLAYRLPEHGPIPTAVWWVTFAAQDAESWLSGEPIQGGAS